MFNFPVSTLKLHFLSLLRAFVASDLGAQFFSSSAYLLCRLSADLPATMLKRLITKTMKAKKKPPAAISTLNQLNETLEMLEKKECILQKKISVEIQKAKDYTKAKNKTAAIQCLKKKKLYEAQIEQLTNFQLRVHDQVILLEGAKATTDTIDALRSGSSAIKSIQQSLSIDDIEKTIEETNEHTENMKQIQEALATPVGVAATFDEDELEVELEELEELEQQLLQPSVEPTELHGTMDLRRKAASQPDSAVDELTELQAEMAM